MGWIWIIDNGSAHDFCVNTFLVLPIFGLAYLVQNPGDLGLTLKDHKPKSSIDLTMATNAKPPPPGKNQRPTPTISGDDLVLSSVGRAAIFLASFVVSSVLAMIGILSHPQPWIVGIIFLTFALTGYALFSRVGTLFVRTLLEKYAEKGGPPVKTSGKIAHFRLFGPLVQELGASRHDTTAIRVKAAAALFLMPALTVGYFGMVFGTALRLFFWTELIN